MNYPDEIKQICINSKNELVEMVKQNEKPFNFPYINNYILKYFELIFDQKNTDKSL